MSLLNGPLRADEDGRAFFTPVERIPPHFRYRRFQCTNNTESTVNVHVHDRRIVRIWSRCTYIFEEKEASPDLFGKVKTGILEPVKLDRAAPPYWISLSRFRESTGYYNTRDRVLPVLLDLTGKIDEALVPPGHWIFINNRKLLKGDLRQKIKSGVLMEGIGPKNPMDRKSLYHN